MGQRTSTAVLALTIGVGCGGIAVAPADAAPSQADAASPVEAAPPDAAYACDCLQAPPWGWRYVVYQAERTACPSGWEAPHDLVELRNEPTPAECECSCTPPTATQTCKLDTVSFDVRANMCSGSTLTGQTFTLGSQCMQAPVTASEPWGIEPFVTWQPQNVQCATSSKVSIPPLDEANARECDPPPPPSACGAGQVCLPPDPDAPWSRCIEKASIDGIGTCPTGFPERHVVAETIKDNRSCGAACICNTFAPCSATIDVYSDTACTSHEATYVPTACYPASGTVSFGSFSATATTAGPVTCGLGWPYPAPEGGVYLQGERVICCP